MTWQVISSGGAQGGFKGYARAQRWAEANCAVGDYIIVVEDSSCC